MNILFVTDYYYPHIGGVEKLFEQLTTRMAAGGHQITYITWRYEKYLSKFENHRGVNIIRVKSPGRVLFPLWALWSIIRHARKADIIHTSTYSSSIGVWLASLFVWRTTIVTVHEVWGKLWNNLPFLSKTEKWLFRFFEIGMLKLRFSHYIAVSDSTRSALLKSGISKSKVTQIYNGVEENLPQWKEPAEPFTFAFFGRAGVSKGLDLLVKAAQIIAAESPGIRFKFIVSPQDDRVVNWLQSEIDTSNLKEISELFQHIPYKQLLNEILHSHCVVIPSYSEGFGFSAAEASAIGIPIISSGRGSLSEVVSGKVIEMEEFSVSGLVEAMKKVMSNEYKEIPYKAFSIETFVDQHKKLYFDILPPERKNV